MTEQEKEQAPAEKEQTTSEKPDAATQSEAEQSAPAKSKLKLILIIGVPVILLIAGLGAWFLFAGDNTIEAQDNIAKAEAIEAPVLVKPLYLSFTDDFTVNLLSEDSTSHYMRVSVVLMTKDPELLSYLKEHEPVLKNDLLALFGEQSFEGLKALNGKKILREKALSVIKEKLDEGQSTKLEAVLFTKFVME